MQRPAPFLVVLTVSSAWLCLAQQVQAVEPQTPRAATGGPKRVLDLRLPATGVVEDDRGASPRAGLSLRHAAGADSGIAGASSLAGLSSRAPADAGVRGFANRFHREGLPVARLWQNHAAMVSLGLNSRGKPGLWLIQKTP